MISGIFSIILFVGLFALAFFAPACMNIGLVRVSNDDYNISTEEYIKCCIPIFNHFYGWKRYSDKYFSIIGISSIVLIFSIILRVVTMYFMYYNNTMQVVSIYIFLASVIVFWITHSITIFSVLSDSGVYTFWSKLLNAFTVIIGEIVIGVYMPKKMKFYNNTNSGKYSLYGRS